MPLLDDKFDYKTVQFSRLAMRVSRANLFDIAKADFEVELRKKKLYHGPIKWYESMESRYECAPFEHISEVTFYAQVLHAAP